MTIITNERPAAGDLIRNMEILGKFGCFSPLPQDKIPEWKFYEIFYYLTLFPFRLNYHKSYNLFSFVGLKRLTHYTQYIPALADMFCRFLLCFCILFSSRVCYVIFTYLKYPPWLWGAHGLAQACMFLVSRHFSAFDVPRILFPWTSLFRTPPEPSMKFPRETGCCLSNLISSALAITLPHSRILCSTSALSRLSGPYCKYWCLVSATSPNPHLNITYFDASPFRPVPTPRCRHRNWFQVDNSSPEWTKRWPLGKVNSSPRIVKQREWIRSRQVKEN
jgi:hypothetical protein